MPSDTITITTYLPQELADQWNRYVASLGPSTTAAAAARKAIVDAIQDDRQSHVQATHQILRIVTDVRNLTAGLVVHQMGPIGAKELADMTTGIALLLDHQTVQT